MQNTHSQKQLKTKEHNTDPILTAIQIFSL